MNINITMLKLLKKGILKEVVVKKGWLNVHISISHLLWLLKVSLTNNSLTYFTCYGGGGFVQIKENN